MNPPKACVRYVRYDVCAFTQIHRTSFASWVVLLDTSKAHRAVVQSLHLRALVPTATRHFDQERKESP